MSSETVVIALGGNSLLSGKEFSIHKEIKAIDESCKAISRIVKTGYRVVISHGNGPQVGDLMIQQEIASGKVPKLPLDVLVSQTQGEIGYLIQRMMKRYLPTRNIAAVLTQVKVDPKDKAFKDPTKFVGPFLKEPPEELGDAVFKKDSDRGFRRVVPSPDPIEIIEKKEIKKLVEDGFLVIACGGGGIPVSGSGSSLKGIEGVIDKDLATERLATSIGAKTMLIVTDVRKVASDYGTRLHKDIDTMNVKEAEVYMMGGHFPPGNMGPKVESAIRFLKKGGRRVIITDRDHALEALRGRDGTVITK